MKRRALLRNFSEKHSLAITIIVAILLFIAGIALSWIITCGIIKLIAMCFGLTFKWSVATGVWLVICLLKSIFNVTIKK